MKISKVQQELADVRAAMTPGTPIEEKRAARKRFEKLRDEIKRELLSLEEQANKENELKERIAKLERSAQDIRDEAKELEAIDLSSRAHQLYLDANDVLIQIKELHAQVLTEWKQNYDKLSHSTGMLESRVQNIEEEFQNLLHIINEKESIAREEDEYPPRLRAMLNTQRTAEFLIKKGFAEHDSLAERAHYLERAQQILAQLPSSDTDAQLKDLDPKIYMPLIAETERYKTAVRIALQEIHHLTSEHIVDTDNAGTELPLAYSVFNQWRKGDKNAFYARLWALNLLLLKNPNQDTPLQQKVRSLLNVINRDRELNSVELEEKQMAAEARRFLLMAGNGVIRRFLADQFNGLRSESDYARLGRALYDPRDPYGLSILRIAVNLPRKFDLTLANRFEGLYEKRLVRTPSSAVSAHPEVRFTDDLDDLPDVPPEELDRGWEVELLAGELSCVNYVERTMQTTEVGRQQYVEAQEYILDTSESMFAQGYSRYPNKRWLLRNAIFISALNTYSVDAAANNSTEFKNQLFFRFFGSEVHDLNATQATEYGVSYPLPVQRFPLRTTDDAYAALKLFMQYNPNGGGTQLQEAILQGFRDIQSAKGATRALRDAKLVLVTDGDSELTIDQLIQAQQIKDTRTVVHVFALEQENPDLRELSDMSGPGQAFYHFIQHAGDGNLQAMPPYGTKEEFSPVYSEPKFASDAERNTYEERITEMCREILEAHRKERTETAETAKIRSRELDALMHARRPGATHKNAALSRKSQRMRDIFNTMHALHDDDRTDAESMELLRELGSARGVLFKDVKAICESPGEKETQEALKRYKEEILPKLRKVA